MQHESHRAVGEISGDFYNKILIGVRTIMFAWNNM